ncbi:type II toxin-antitoxin system HipA family toxin [Hyphomicrobium sp. 1Nfss2.1]|uniref:type II toxin-antitoxin system HipA family toxin n=1 Tax=Hyphomicrobium sp. 1Nfss2.1 TaxID=3413936 RepID=UPI003C7B035B
MTSRKAKRCYVYITLPGELEAVTAARFELSDGVGKLVYGRSYLARNNAVEIDPVELKLGTQQYETALLRGVFGALRDASPDYWGRLVIDRAAGKAKLDEVDYLIQSADDRAGALGFGHNENPPAPKRDFNKTLDLKSLQETALALLKNDGKLKGSEAVQAQKLLLLGTSMGGMRPKAVVEDSKGLWIAKFNRPDDRWNNARVEHAMLTLARRCGIAAAESRVVKVGDRDILLVKRFDREKTKDGYLRSRMVSGLTLLRADDVAGDRAKWSYPALAEELRRVCSEPRESANELFRRMVFNALISNTDDHPRNHAIIASDRSWQLSPAYDLTPTPSAGMERDLAMTIGDFGRRATAQNLVTQSARFLLLKEQAETVVAKMERIVRGQWETVARAAKVTVKDCATIRNALENEGFSFEAGEAGAL